MGSHRNFRTWMDAFGVAIIFLFVVVCLGSLVLDIKYWGLSGFVLGRLFNRNDGGGIHTLAVLGVIIPSFLWGRKTGTNMMIVAISAFLTDYYHEGLWNIPYYLYYRMRLDQVPLYALMALFCFIWFGTIIYSKREHNFRHFLYLLPWLALVVAYVLTVHHYSEDLFGPQAFYSNVLVNGYEVLEVNVFAWSLYFAITRGAKKAPVLSTVFRLPAVKVPAPAPVVSASGERLSVGGFVSYAMGIPIFWVITIDVGLVWLLRL